MRTKVLAMHCFRRGLSVEAKAWEREGEIGKAWLIPKEFVLHSGRIRGATRLAAIGANPSVMQRKGR